MNNKERLEKLEFMQHFFVKSFIISFILLILSTILCMAMHDFQMIYVEKYFDLDAENFNKIVVLLLGIWKLLIVQFTLVPALVVLFIRKCGKCNCGCN